MSKIEFTIFEKPAGNVRGIVTVFVPLPKRRSNIEEVRVAHGTLHVDGPPSVQLSVPANVPLADIPAVTEALNAFHAKLLELDHAK
jgi:hypothetical protein